MDSYRPRDYDDMTQRRETHVRNDNDDSDFKIRGRAQMARARSRSRSPPRRQYYRDPDRPARSRDSDYYYYSRSDDRYNSRYNSSSDYHPRGYSDGYSDDRRYDYDDPIEPEPSNGDADVSPDGAPIQFLLIRGLKPSVDETLLSKGLEKLYLDENDSVPAVVPGAVPGAVLPATPAIQPGATPNSLKRVFIIRDRLSEKSLSFGYAEFHSLLDAKAALAKADQLGDKCTISSKRMMIGYPHLGVFPPVVLGQSNEPARFLFQMRDGTARMYHDTRYYASALEVNAAPLAPPKSKSPKPEANSKSAKKRPLEIGQTDGFLRNDTKKPKQGPAITEYWQMRNAERRGEDGIEADEQHPIPNSGDSSNSGANMESGAGPQSFIFIGKLKGKERKCCFLCGNDLGPTVGAEAHVKRSQVHLENLKDDAKCQKGIENLKRWGIAEDATVRIRETNSSSNKPAYRDRAKERRIQEAKAGIGEKLKMSLKGAASKNTDTSGPTAPSYGKGAAMLQKAGWSEGQGLGSGSGNGISAPIDTFAYNAGVGLGHEASKKGDAHEEAARLTKDDRGSFLAKTKEVARERFERMK